MWVAAIETGLFVIAGISAYNLLRRRNPEFFVRSFRLALTLLVVVAPLQIWLGDSSGVDVFATQPAKGAAIEGHWQTNAPRHRRVVVAHRMARPRGAEERLVARSARRAEHPRHPHTAWPGQRPRRHSRGRPAADAAAALLRVSRDGRHRLPVHGARVLDGMGLAAHARPARRAARASQAAARLGARDPAALYRGPSRAGSCAKSGASRGSSMGCCARAMPSRHCTRLRSAAAW